MVRRFRAVEILALILTAVLLAVIFWLPPQEPPRDLVVVAFGDSLTRGYGVPPGKNFVTYLSEYTRIPIINSGKSGDTTADALVRLQKDVLDYQPDIVLVLLGGNDFLEENSEEVVLVNLKTIIRKIHSGGAKIILIGGSKQVVPNYEYVYERLAMEEKVNTFVPNILGAVLFRKDLLYDQIHPNDRGHEIIAQKLLPALEKVLRE